MAIYLDVSAAVHRRVGLGRYAESLTRALVAFYPNQYVLYGTLLAERTLRTGTNLFGVSGQPCYNDR